MIQDAPARTEEETAIGSRLGIHLLGIPMVVRGPAGPARPRGRKAWALLAYLIRTESTPSRQFLAELLFGDAQDPLGALRWNLAELRRVLGRAVDLGGDPVRLTLPPGTFVDVRAISSGTWEQAIEVPSFGSELLAGISPPTSPGFEIWLLTERRNIASLTRSVLREAAHARLAGRDAEGAIELASRLVTSDPLDEDNQELLVRAYLATGDREAAKRQQDLAVTLIRRELGVAPGPGLLSAADAAPAPPANPSPNAGLAALASLETGLAAMAAGATEAGLRSLRDAVALSEPVDATELHGRALAALGSALVHGVRGHDGEGASVLHAAAYLGERTSASLITAHAYRELGYIETLRGRYDRAERWLQRATAVAPEGSVERAWAHAVRGTVHSDVGRHADAIRELQLAIDLTTDLSTDGDFRQVYIWALTFMGRAHLLRGELATAEATLGAAVAATHAANWIAFLPLPEALLAEVHLAQGQLDRAAAAYEHAYALALQLGDPCWEGIAGRGMGLVAARRGKVEEASVWLTHARASCRRLHDSWLWAEAYCLDALCDITVVHDRARAAHWIDELESLAARTGMRELVARAYLHRSRLGDASAVDGARILAAEVDDAASLRDSSSR